MIRNFGNDTECTNGDELMSKLKELYSGMSVTIQYKVRSGMKLTEHVDVSEDGKVTYSYKKDMLLDKTELEMKAVA
ncbi:TPA: hypothetical protein ACGSTL_001273 [Vibrio parahaemolyticus]